MTRHFVEKIREFIAEKKLQNLSSDGWSRMREVERNLVSGSCNEDEAIAEFLKERDFSYKLDRHDKEDLKKMLK